MGYPLRREVRDLLPPGRLTASERLLVLELADSCNDDTREGWPGIEWLAEKADVPEPKVGEMFGRIGRKWTELRVPMGFGKDGRPFYARAGHRTKFRFPPTDVLLALREAPLSGGPAEAPEIGGAQGTRIRGAEAPQNRGARPPKTGGPSTQGSTQKDHSSLSSGEPDEPTQVVEDRERDESASLQELDQLPTKYRVLAQRGYTGEKADKVIPLIIAATGGTPKGPKWWATVDQNRDLDEILTEVAPLTEDAAPSRPDWCGNCDQRNRQVQVEDMYGRGKLPARCPDCHPLAVADAAREERDRERRRARGEYVPYRNPVDQSDYDLPL